MRARRDARIIALLVLYEADTAQHPAGLVLQRHLQERGDLEAEIREYARDLVSGVVKQFDSLNTILHECAPDFPVEQIAPVDRNILRIALFEMTTALTPTKVAINEAIEISKEFGSESTPRFVNGVLGAAAVRLPGNGAQGKPAPGRSPSEGQE